MLQLGLLGTPTIRLNNQSLTRFKSSKTPALLFYLAHEKQVYNREQLAALLWPDLPSSRSKANLRDTLSDLRNYVDDYICLDGALVYFYKTQSHTIDTDQFKNTISLYRDLPVERWDETAVADLTQSLSLIRGDFLAGFHVTNASEYHEWISATQEQYRQLIVQTYTQLIDYAIYQHKWSQGIHFALEFLAIDPWREETHAQLMLLYSWNDQRSAALSQYETCQQILQQQFSAEPSQETQSIYQQIHHNTLPRPNWRETAVIHPPPRHNLPAELTRFIGREEELDTILPQLADPACRLLSLIGPGGAGKTRLAVHAGRQLIPQMKTGELFSDGIYFVSLASVEVDFRAPHPPTHLPLPIASAIADALNITIKDPQAQATRFINFLQSQNLLLILDNFEHLLPAAPHISHLLELAPTIKIIITSRTRLKVRGEHVIPIDGLPYPLADEPEPVWAASSAIRLFIEQARATSPTFSADDLATQTAVTQICRLVNGLPLGIELAASWVRLLSCCQIAQELEENLQFLKLQGGADLPERHRSLWGVFHHSWNRLSATSQSVLRQLSIFRGGFTRDAATIAHASLPDLGNLLDHSLIRTSADNTRYHLPEIIRRFADEQLQQHPAELAEVSWQHSAYYLHLLQRCLPQLQGAEQGTALESIHLEINNIRTAWRFAIAHGDTALLTAGTESLFHYYDMRSRFQEGEESFARAVSRLKQLAQNAPLTPAQEILLGMLLARHGWFAFHTGHTDAANGLLTESVNRLRPLNAPHALIFSLNYLGAFHLHMGHYPAAESLCHESLALSESLPDPEGTGIALNILSQIAYATEQYDLAQAYGQRSLAIVNQLGNPYSRAFSLTNLGRVALKQGNFVEAQKLFTTIFSIREQMGDLRGMAICLEQMGQTAVHLQEFAQATPHFQQSLALYRKINNVQGITSSLLGLSHLSLQQQDYATALAYLNQALQKNIELQTAHQGESLLRGLEYTYTQLNLLSQARLVQTYLQTHNSTPITPFALQSLYTELLDF